MNKKLLEMRKKFAGQKVSAPMSNFDNSPFEEGIHTFRVAESEVKDITRKDNTFLAHYIRLVCEEDTPDNNKSAFPFPNSMEEAEGVASAAVNMARVLGTDIPGMGQGGEIDLAAFIPHAETLAAQMVDELVEGRIVNSKKSFKDDGTPWQSVYINRGLGKDTAANRKARSSGPQRETATDDDDLKFGSEAKAGTKRKVAKKKVAKKTAKKTAKKKTARRS